MRWCGYRRAMTTAPLEPDLPPPGDGIPAADPGAGAPPPAEGFGVEGEEPDRADGSAEGSAPVARDTPFRTPDPTVVGPDGQG